MAEKPKIASVVETAIRVRHKLGATETELVSDAQNLMEWAAENFLMDNEEEIGVVERNAFEKLFIPMLKRGAARYVKKTLAG